VRRSPNSSLDALASPSDRLALASPSEPTTPGGLATPGATPNTDDAGGEAFNSFPSSSSGSPGTDSAKRRKKKASKPSLGEFQDVPVIVADPPVAIAAAGDWDAEEEVVVEKRRKKRSAKSKDAGSGSFAAKEEEVVEIEHDEPAPAPTPAKLKPVTFHTSAAMSASKPKPPSTLSPPSTDPALDESNEWDREPAEALPSRMARKVDSVDVRAPFKAELAEGAPFLGRAPLSKAPLPPMSVGRPPSTLSLGVSTPLRPSGSATTTSPLKPLGAAKLPLRASKPLVKPKHDEEELELDISTEDATTAAAATRKVHMQIDESVEIEHDWDE
jgi:hypothetical protein